MKNPALIRAIKNAGNQTILAKRLGLTPQAVQFWTTNRLPADWVVRVEAETGVPRHELRPDLYPTPGASQEKP